MPSNAVVHINLIMWTIFFSLNNNIFHYVLSTKLLLTEKQISALQNTFMLTYWVL